MPYLGPWPRGAEIRATFDLDASASGEAFLLVAAAVRGGGTTVSDDGVAVPGGAATVSLTPQHVGRLGLQVDCAGDADRGRIRILKDGQPSHATTVTGDTRYWYTVV